MAELASKESINAEALKYVNRLSDLLFVLGREQGGNADGHARGQDRLLHRHAAQQRGYDQGDSGQAGIVAAGSQVCDRGQHRHAVTDRQHACAARHDACCTGKRGDGEGAHPPASAPDLLPCGVVVLISSPMPSAATRFRYGREIGQVLLFGGISGALGKSLLQFR